MAPTFRTAFPRIFAAVDLPEILTSRERNSGEFHYGWIGKGPNGSLLERFILRPFGYSFIFGTSFFLALTFRLETWTALLAVKFSTGLK